MYVEYALKKIAPLMEGLDPAEQIEIVGIAEHLLAEQEKRTYSLTNKAREIVNIIFSCVPPEERSEVLTVLFYEALHELRG